VFVRSNNAFEPTVGVKKLLLSGASAPSYNEVKTMRRYLVEQGVPEADLVVDPTGYRTFDSLYRARDVYGLRSLLVVTNAPDRDVAARIFERADAPVGDVAHEVRVV